MHQMRGHRAKLDESPDGGSWFRGLRVAWVAMAVALVALFARIMSFPVRHDEQFYVPAGALFSAGGLYRDFGYNHLPNLPILLSSIYQLIATDHYLLVGRLMIFAFWILGAASILLVARRAHASLPLTIFASALYLTNPVLIGQAGMSVSNNFIPIPLSLLGVHFFTAGTDRDRPRRWYLFASGFAVALAMGFKANYIFLAPCFAIAALLASPRLSWAERLTRIVAPFVLGGVIGGLPTLAYLASDPDGFLAHVVRYHREAQVGYWSANSDLDGAKAMGFGQKAMLAHSLWVLGAGGLIPLAMMFLFAVMAMARGFRSAARALWSLPLMLAMSLFLLGAAISFVPTPAFPQYFAPPIIFGIAAILFLWDRLDERERQEARPFLVAATCFALLSGGPQLFAAAPQLASPRQWTGLAVHRDAMHLAALARNSPGPVATLAPIYVLEGGRQVYPELASAFVNYRVGDFLRQHEAAHYRYLTSPTAIGALLERRPPGALLVGTEGAIELPLVDYARRHCARALRNGLSDRRVADTAFYTCPSTLAAAR